MQVTDITRVADEVTSAAVSTVNDSLVTAAREGERLATHAAGWFERLAGRLTPRSPSPNRRTAVVIAVAGAVVLWMVVRRVRRTAEGADGDGNVESLTPGDDQPGDAPSARQAS